MSVDGVSKIFAVLAAISALLGLAGWGVGLGGRRTAALRTARAAEARGVATLIAAVSTVGSLYLSQVAHFEPCQLCWVQRICMYPLSIILMIGSLRRDVTVWLYALPIALGGLAVAAWHMLVEQFPTLESTECSLTVPCTLRYLDVFGVFTIPTMAACGFLGITGLLVWSRG